MPGRKAAWNGGRPRDETLQLMEFGCGPGFSRGGRFEHLRVCQTRRRESAIFLQDCGPERRAERQNGSKGAIRQYKVERLLAARRWDKSLLSRIPWEMSNFPGGIGSGSFCFPEWDLKRGDSEGDLDFQAFIMSRAGSSESGR